MPRARLSEDELERVAALRERGLSYGQIARKIGCSEGSVGWALLKLGIDIHQDKPLKPVPVSAAPIKRGKHLVRPFTQDEDARLLALEATGMKTHAIARSLGRRNNSVIGRMRTLARRQAREEAQA